MQRVIDSAAWLALFALNLAFVLEVRGVQWASTPTHDLWMFLLPGGYEVDYQRNRESGAWGLFWQESDGGSQHLAGDRS